MVLHRDSFEYDYRGMALKYGRGCVQTIGQKLNELEYDRVLVVTGRNVGTNPAVMEPVKTALSDHTVEIFAETTPAKRADTAFEGIEILREMDADVIIGVGGGSSLDVARQMSVFEGDNRSLESFRTEAKSGSVQPPVSSPDRLPVIVVPTTFAGADMSAGGSIELLSPEESPSGDPVRTSGLETPKAVFYDPDLFETSPISALAGSAMNGFNKGIESLYARTATPITDSTAIQGLNLLRHSLPRLSDDNAAIDHAVTGIILVQFDRQTSIIHAFGHGFSRRYDIQQGIAHAIMLPHVLRYLFSHSDAGRELIAQGLGIDTTAYSDDEIASKIIKTLNSIRTSLDIPTQIRELEPVSKADLSVIAESVIADYGMDNLPQHLNPSQEDIEKLLHDAW